MILVGVLCSSMFMFVPFGLTASQPPQLEWAKTYPGATSFILEGLPYIITQTVDGGYAVAGSTDKVQSGIWSFWLIRTDSNGIVQWNRTYGGSERSRLWSFSGTSDGGYILAGDLPDSGYSGLLVETDSNGNMQWNRTYPQSDVRSVIQSSDGGYALACIVSGAGNDGALIKTDPQGNTLWEKTCGGPSNDQFECVVQTADGGYTLAGATQSYSTSGKTEAWLVKTDSDGAMQWNKTYSRTAGHDYGRSMIQTSDGGYAIAGQTDYFGSGDAWLIKTDITGNLVWDKTYDGNDSDFASSLVQASDEGYALAGQTDFWGSGDAWLIRTDSGGSELWNETFGGSGYDRGCSVIQTRDGGFALSGFTNSFSGDSSYEVYVIKLGSEVTAYHELMLQIIGLRADLETLNSQVANLNIAYNQVLQNYSELLTRFNILNSSNQQHLQDYDQLQATLNSLTSTLNILNATINDYKFSTENQLTFLTNIVYSLIAITVILVAATCYFATRKPKQDDSLYKNRNEPRSSS